MTVLSLRRHIPLLTLSLTLAMASVALALRLGSADIPSAEVWAHVIADDGSINDRIIDQLRLPRALTAFAVGGLLALAGALIQVLLRNPLGDPYVLGVSGGASTSGSPKVRLSRPFHICTARAILGKDDGLLSSISGRSWLRTIDISRAPS